MKIGVIGAGTWGIALARMLTNSGHEVIVWSAIESEIDELSATRLHKNLPGMVIPDGTSFTKDLALGQIPDCYTGHSLLKKHEYPYVMIEYCGGGCPDLSRRQLKVAAFDMEWFVGTLCSLDEDFSFNKITEIYNLKDDPLQKKNLIGKCSAEQITKYINAIMKRFEELKNNGVKT